MKLPLRSIVGFLAICILLDALFVACSDDTQQQPVATASPTSSTSPSPATPALPTIAVPTSAAAESSPTPVRSDGPVLTPSPSPLPPTAVPTEIPTPLPTSGNATHARHGGTLNLVSRQTIGHQDVHRDVSSALAAWGPGIAYSRLMRFRSGSDVPLPSLDVECEICNGWSMVNDTTFEFTIRNDVSWQELHPVNGRRLVAGDIAYSYERQRATSAPNAALLHIVDRIDAPSDDLLRVSLLAPYADFLVALADGHSKIVAREAVELNGDLSGGPTIGAGAWILNKIAADTVFSFRRNESYFAGELPLLDSLSIHVITDIDTAYAAFRVNNVDVHRLRPQEWNEFSKQRPDASVLAFKEIGTGLEVAFKTTVPPFDDVRVRRAAMMAMRPTDAIEEIWHGAAYLTQGVPLANSDWRISEDELGEFFDSHSRARALLADAATALPIPVEIKVGDYGIEYRMHAERIAEEMLSVGFEPQLDLVDRRWFGERVWLAGDYEMFVGPIAPIATPNGYFLSVLSSTGAWNTTGHSNDELDSLILAQAGEYDPRERRRLAIEAQRIALESAYRFMPAAAVSLWAWWPNVEGLEPNFVGSEYSHWERVWLKQ